MFPDRELNPELAQSLRLAVPYINVCLKSHFPINNRDTEPCLLVEDWNPLRKNPQNVLSFLYVRDPLTHTLPFQRLTGSAESLFTSLSLGIYSLHSKVLNVPAMC